MGKVIFGMTMSLDGFVADATGDVGALYADFAAFGESEIMQEAIHNTGAVVMGRKTFAMADDPDSYADTYEFQVPIFVVTHDVPARRPKENATLRFTFVTDGVESAVAQAKAAAGAKDVTIVGGAALAQQCFKARMLDELHIDIMPVLLCGGLRLFDDIGDKQIALERLNVTPLPSGRTHLRFRVVK